MDVVCMCCGERWQDDFVPNDEPPELNRMGGFVRKCPSCSHSCEEWDLEDQLAMIRELATFLGEVIEELIQTVESLNPMEVVTIDCASEESGEMP